MRITHTAILAVLPLISGGTRLCVVTNVSTDSCSKVVDMDFNGLPYSDMVAYLFNSHRNDEEGSLATVAIRNLISRNVTPEQSEVIMKGTLA